MEGLSNIHAESFAHRNLTPHHITLDSALNIKFIDLAFAGQVWNLSPDDFRCTPAYAPPELLRRLTSGNTYQTVLAPWSGDIWSCGVILYYMLCGHSPFWDEEQRNGPQDIFERIEAITTQGLRFPSKVSKNAKTLINGMLQVDPSQRLSIEKILAHPWLKH